MRRILFIITTLFTVSMIMFAANYSLLWKDYRSYYEKDQPRSAIATLEKIRNKAVSEKNYGNLLAALIREANHWDEISSDSGEVWRQRLDSMFLSGESKVDGVMRTLYRFAKHDEINIDSLLASPDSAKYRTPNAALSWSPFLEQGKDSKIFSNDLLHVLMDMELFHDEKCTKVESLYGKNNEYAVYHWMIREQVETEPTYRAVFSRKHVSTDFDNWLYFRSVRNIKGFNITIGEKGKAKHTLNLNIKSDSTKQFVNDSLHIGKLTPGKWVVTITDIEKKTTPVTDTLTVSDTRYIELPLPDNKRRIVYVNAITGEETTRGNMAEPRRTYWRYNFQSIKGTQNYCNIYTDRALYRPGQKVNVAVILSSVTDGITPSVRADEKVAVTLRNNRGNTVEQKTIVTDEYGTAHAEFVLPDYNIESGSWRIQAENNSCYFNVEEYKRPTFEVTMTKPEGDAHVGDTVIVTGLAKTYSGVPVMNSRVITTIEDTDNHADTLYTDNEGRFTVPVVISETKHRYYWWRRVRVSAAVTDIKGETQSGDCIIPVKGEQSTKVAEVENTKKEQPADTRQHTIYYTLFSENKILEDSKTVSDTASFVNSFKYKEEYGDGALLCFAWCKNDTIHTKSKQIRRPLPSCKLTMEWGTFRDKLAPGQHEQWTLKVSAEDGTEKSSVLAVLYDKSLDAIYPHSWHMQDYRRLAIPYTSWRFLNPGGLYFYGSARNWVKYRNYEFTHLGELCGLNSFGRRFRIGAFNVQGDGRMYKAVASAMPMADAMEESAVMNVATVQMAKGMVANDAEMPAMAPAPIVPRSNFGETAFFFPSVKTNTENTAELSFTLPESVTTWRFMALAHDKQMRYATLDTTVVTQKQIMVQPNMPRFLRVGDKTVVISNVANLSDKDMKATVVMKVNGKETKQKVNIEAGRTMPVSFPIEAKDTTSLLCTITASSGKYSDGEQHLIPVLEVATDNRPTISSYTLDPDSVMKSTLPELAVPKSIDAMCLSNALYANYVAAHLNDTIVSPANDNVLVQLLKLQNSDGSFSWYPGMEGSMYMTQAVLMNLVRLQYICGRQSCLTTMTDKAFLYMEGAMKKEVEEMKKHKWNWLSSTALDWLYCLSLTNRNGGSAEAFFKKMLKEETNKSDMATKAVAALIFANDGKKKEAKTYIESIKQHTVYREDMGRYFDSYRTNYSWCDYRIPSQSLAIEAMQTLTPEDNCTIQQMQRWLFSSKKTQRWDNPVNTVNAVNAFYLKTAVCPEEQELMKKHSFVDTKKLKNIIKVHREIVKDGKTIDGKKSALKVGDKVTVRITIECDRDYDFVSVADHRAACLEPVEQLSCYWYGYYQQMKDSRSEFFFNCLSKGKHIIETDYYVNQSGEYSSGDVTAVCTYAPEYQGIETNYTLTAAEAVEK